jgi:hypothetical protein
MKSFTILLILTLVLITWVANGNAGDLSAQKSGGITSQDIPECLHIGIPVKAMILVDSGEAGYLFDLALISQSGKVSASFRRTGGIGAPIEVTFHGEDFGTDIVTIISPGKPYLAPLTSTIRVLPSFEPPQDLSMHPTEIMSHPVPDAESDTLFREVIYRWRPKEGVKDYGVDTYDSELSHTQGSMFSARSTRGMAWVTPGERRYWRIQAKIDTCRGGERWTRNSAYIPFDS